MRIYIRYYLCLFLLLIAVGCSESQLSMGLYDQEDECITLDFAYKEFERVDISTRAALPAAAEARVINLYVMVFDHDGARVFNRFFDTNNRKENLTEYSESNETYDWYVDEKDPTAGAANAGFTFGQLRIKAPRVDNGTIYLFANLDFNLLNFSRSALDHIQTKGELNDFVCQYIEPTLFRIGNFLMVGHTAISTLGNNVTLGSENSSENGTYMVSQNNGVITKRIMLENLDAKVEFKVGVVPGAVKEREEVQGGNTVTVSQKVQSFTPTSWQVFNLPKGSSLLPKSTDATIEATGGFFDSEIYEFETTKTGVSCMGYAEDDRANTTLIPTTRDEYGFTFYSLENRQSVNKHKSVLDPTVATTYTGIKPFHLRDKRNKNSYGVYTMQDDNEWEFAPEYGTYVLIEGDLGFDYDEEGSAQGGTQTLFATVRYLIHLGDFQNSTSLSGTPLDNYDVERNHHYIYTINIKGVDAIEVEVAQDVTAYQVTNETQSAATGGVVLSQEEIYVFDAHYSQRVYNFNALKMLSVASDPSKLTWSVETPFGRNGSPARVGVEQVEVPHGLDYKWVHFMLNSKEASYTEPKGNPQDGGEFEITNPWFTEEKHNYCNYNRIWPGKDDPQLMDVMQLCDYLRGQVTKYKQNMDNSVVPPNTGTDFDDDGNIVVTAFIDEYYYDRDPISQLTRPSLWHEFVNQPMRSMHIMCDQKSSADGSSTTTGTAISIRQRSIQTIYSDAATEGWGSESIDEMGYTVFYEAGQTRNNAKDSTYSENNNSIHNGLYNTALIWGVTTGGNADPDNNPSVKSTRNSNSQYWATYLDYVRENDQLDSDNQTRLMFMRKDATGDYVSLRYSCMMRNRDENGNGVIDEDEIKWYMASQGQCQYLYIGDAALSSGSRLYTPYGRNNVDVTPNLGNTFKDWRVHVVTSTKNKGKNANRPAMIWAEEGISVSSYGFDNGWSKPGAYTVRCVRNLDEISGTRDVTLPSDYPSQPVELTLNSDGTYRFDLSNMNPLALRIKSQTELLPMDENSTMSRPYRYFETGPVGNDNNTLTYQEWIDFSNERNRGLSRCPEGYRMPNIREMSLMYLMITDNTFWSQGNYWTQCNYISFGSTKVGGTGWDIANDNQIYSVFFSKTESNVTVEPKAGADTQAKIRCVRDVD